MAFLSHHPACPMRNANKEPQWASVYDDLFDQYIDSDGFEFGTCDVVAASSSDEGSNNAAASVEMFPENSESSSSEIGRGFDDFWTRTVQVLEQSAAPSVQSRQVERNGPLTASTKDHPHSDFLSLGGFPSPHIASTSSSPSEAARRRKTAGSHSDRSNNLTKRASGINKAYRFTSKSPDMMSPSRYRAGAPGVWADGIYRAHSMAKMDLPVRSVPLSPPPTTRGRRSMGYGDFSSPRDFDAAPFQSLAHFGELDSPLLATTFSQIVPIHLHSLDSSPLTTPGGERAAAFGDGLNDTPSRGVCFEPVDYNKAAWTANSFETEDIYEPSPTFSPWIASEEREAQYRGSTNAYTNCQSFKTAQSPHCELSTSGLMISYDPTLAPSRSEEMAEEMDAPVAPLSPCYITADIHRSREEPRTPSPPRRQRRAPSSKGHSRKTSGQQSPRGGSKSGFVNYTPSDSEKLLTGVAPSGSSKTKARREREAAEKRRRFSQAAVKAVVEAGGNLAKLRDSGLFTG